MEKNIGKGGTLIFPGPLRWSNKAKLRTTPLVCHQPRASQAGWKPCCSRAATPRTTLSGALQRRADPDGASRLALCGRVLLYVGEALFSRKHAFVQRAGLSNKTLPVAVAIRPREFYDFAHLISREGNDRRTWECEYHASPGGFFPTPH